MWILTERNKHNIKQIRLQQQDILFFQSLSPGPVDTEFAEANNLFSSEQYKEVYGKLPKLLPKDVADSVLYVLSTPPTVQVSSRFALLRLWYHFLCF